MKTNWINFLHFYLPPTSEVGVVTEATDRSYAWILEMANKYKNWRFTINMNASLTNLLKDKHNNIIAGIKNLIDQKQLELVDSLAFHPIAPLLPAAHIIRQIKINQEVNQQAFGVKAQGFFLPEMAYAPSLGNLLVKLGYKWLILDEISHEGKEGKIDWQKKYQLKNSNLNVVYRSRQWSKDYPPRLIVQKSSSLPPYIVSATDAELYGHRFVDWEGWLAKALDNPNIKCLTISEYLNELKQIIITNPVASHWESLEKEIKKLPFSLWLNKKNRIQKKLWKLARLALDELDKNPADANFHWAEKHLDQGLASCTFWWASGHDFNLFGAPAWKPDEVEKGATELVKSIRSLKISAATKLRAEKYYHQIKKLLWTKHWKQYAK